MFYAKQYLLAQSLEEAYQANQKRSAAVVGGMCWMKMGRRQLQTVIDLSALGLDEITPTASGFAIGAMVTLRQLETHPGLEKAFGGAFAQAVRPIVGVQFRSCATVGGSVWGRFGFSDVLTVLLALDAKVELYPSGVIALEDFIKMPRDNQILVRVLVEADGRRAAVESCRNSATDFPVLVTAAARMADGSWRLAVGARPQKAALVRQELPPCPAADAIAPALAEGLAALPFGGNMRASEEYRRHLAPVLLRRAITKLEEDAPWKSN